MIYLLHLLLILLHLLLTRGGELRSVNTSWGILRGELISPGTDDLSPVTQYLGVPYGVAPTGQYRFNMAISAAKWSHMPKEARTTPPSCVQAGLPELSETRAFKVTSAQRFDYLHRLLPRLKAQSEDCLYMNLYVPERLPSTTRSQPLSVLVLVHGDEYGWNSGTPYNGTILASFGQVIVVTLNYRLGVFGFLGRCESSSCVGNSGISDLVSALTMLSSILPAFGGNHREITLMGWGSGGALVSLLMSSPLTAPSRRLFARAILLDGTALAPWALSDDPQAYFMQIAERLGCINRVNVSSNAFNDGVESHVRCMQDQSAENITRAAHSLSVPSFLNAFAPIIDGQLVPNKPSTLFSAQYGSLFREIDLMVGTVSNPAHHLLSNEDLRHGMHRDRREKILRTLVRNYYRYHRTEILASTVNEYTDWNQPKENAKGIRDSVLGILSDVFFTAPLVETLRAHSSDETRRESNTFFFHFGHETRSWMAEQPNNGVHGSLTGDHVPYILGYPLSRINNEDKLYSGFDAEDRGLSRVMMHYISNFIKSGDPLQPLPMTKQTHMEDRFSSIAWPQYNQPNREAYLDISRLDDRKASVKNYYRNAHVAFWTGLVPQLHVSGREGFTIPEEHNFLPDYFQADSFFGRVRPYSSYSNMPFPPPPMPPTPSPPPIKKTTTTQTPTVVGSPTPTAVAPLTTNATILLITLIIGCSLLLINCVFACGIYRKCQRARKSKKKLQLQYQTYSSNHAQNPELNYGMNSPMLPPPPPMTMPSGGSHTSSHHHASITTNASGAHSLSNDPDAGPSYFPNFAFVSTPHHHCTSNGGGGCGSLPRNGLGSHTGNGAPANLQEQEPLLSASQKTSIAGIRPGVSPTCPRHGRSAMAAAAASRGNSSMMSSVPQSGNASLDRGGAGILPPAQTLEEIQV